MHEIVFFLEELSAEKFLHGIVERMNSENVPVRYVKFSGKNDLEKRLERRIRGYLNPAARFIVLRDQDTEDCKVVKERLSDICAAAGRADAVVRIACMELESFYFGDLAAVEDAMDCTGLVRLAATKRFRDPDLIHRPSAELERLTKGKYQKVIGSELMGMVIDLDNSRSRSFCHLRDSIRQALIPPQA